MNKSGAMTSSKSKKNVSSFDDMTFFYKCFLKLIGVLPFDGRDFTHPLSRLHVTFCIISNSIYWSMYVCYMIDEYRKRIPSTDTIFETVLVFGLVTRYYLLAQRRLEYARLLDEGRAIWDTCDETVHRAVRQFEQKIRFVFKLTFVSWSLTNFMYCLSAAFSTVTAISVNGSHPQYLPFKWYTVDSPTRWLGYKMTFAVQALVEQNACIVASSVDAAGPYLIMIGAGYFRALRQRLLLIVEDDDSELIACLRLHQRILKLCSRIEKVTRSLFFVQLLSTVYNLSLLGIKIAGSDPDRFKYVPFILSMLSQLFVCQWAPDHLINESTAISTAVYSVSFSWMRRRLGKLLVLVIARSQRPVQMTAAGIVNLSLEKFGSMLTSAISFFTVLRNFNM